MAYHGFSSHLGGSALVLLLFFIHIVAKSHRKVYIIYMGELPIGHSNFDSHAVHKRILQQVLEKTSPDESLIYSYGKSFNGFAAKLTSEEKDRIADMDGVVVVFPSQEHHLMTTRSWDFLGFPLTIGRQPKVETKLTVGVMDTGIWPYSDIFNDEGFGPPPAKWSGSCQKITCNNKLIGAKFYYSGDQLADEELLSPLDIIGHGTHTASIIAGREVRNSSFFGLAEGVARGAVPSARIAVYKVCWKVASGEVRCKDEDILAAFNDAIDDGVDIISASLGSDNKFKLDCTAIGSFHAFKNNILTSAASGNSGPVLQSISNFAPWILTVAATSTDRRIIGQLELGNGVSLTGNVINSFDTQQTFYPIVYGEEGDTDTEEKIILCESDQAVNNITSTGAAAGLIWITDLFTDRSCDLPMAGVCLTSIQSVTLNNYLNNTRDPVGKIYKSNAVHNPKAPVVASFSSRGPSKMFSDILKPDISAPGVEILASWSPKGVLSDIKGDNRSSLYRIVSGTSMACPHTTGAALYVKSFPPSWSPSAIKSALMTTAFPMSDETNIEGDLAYGAGQIDPVKAVNPGLVYDAAMDDYVRFLCGQAQGSELVRLIGENNTCSDTMNGTAWDLNYPSFALSATLNKPVSHTFNRTVTNVGLPNSTYKASVFAAGGLGIQVEPSVLSFTSVGQKQSFLLTVRVTLRQNVSSGYLLWGNGVFQVRSPIVVYAIVE